MIFYKVIYFAQLRDVEQDSDKSVMIRVVALYIGFA